MGGKPRAVAADHDGFDLGVFEEDARGHRRSGSTEFACADRTTVRVSYPRTGGHDRTFYGLCVPRAPIVASIVLPDGRRAADAGARIYTRCTAVVDADWRTLPIHVDVRLKGYERLQFEYYLGDPLPVRALTAKRAG